MYIYENESERKSGCTDKNVIINIEYKRLTHLNSIISEIRYDRLLCGWRIMRR